MTTRAPAVGFIGLGSQGGPIARRIVESGYPLTLWARRPETLHPFAGTSAATASTPAELAEHSDIVDVIGDNGKVSVLNPFAPQYFHRMKVSTTLGTRRERFSRKATYDFQLEAFVAAVEDGASFPTTATDAIRTMELIDSIYLAAGLPARQPTPPQGSASGPATNGPLQR